MSEVTPLPDRVLDEIRRTRRHPRYTQTEYLVLRYIVSNLEQVLGEVRHPVRDVLDLYCGTSPYRDLVPPHTRYVTLDINDRYGVPDIVTEEFLPLPDASFDLILFTEAFHYLQDPERGVAELQRVLRPGGTLVMTVPLVWEYDRRIVERRYTGPHLASLFEAWNDVRLMENGGYSVTWATVTGRVMRGIVELMPARVRPALDVPLKLSALLLNFVGTLLSRSELRWHTGPYVLPFGHTLTARRPFE
jgi:SAM-dependent methyltransferase